jgi:hypothetical protein
MGGRIIVQQEKISRAEILLQNPSRFWTATSLVIFYQLASVSKS